VLVVAYSVSFHCGWDGGLGLAAGWLAGGLCDGGCGGGARDRGGAEGGGSVMLMWWWRRAGRRTTGYMLVLVLVLVVSLCGSDDTQSSSTFSVVREGRGVSTCQQRQRRGGEQFAVRGERSRRLVARAMLFGRTKDAVSAGSEFQ
jgi:hypothetical protein